MAFTAAYGRSEPEQVEENRKASAFHSPAGTAGKAKRDD
jgi:hypothetical protein